MSIFTLQNSINFAKTYQQYSPLTAGLGNEPAVSIGSMIKNSILNAPMTWFFNRAETTFATVAGTQDYTRTISDLSFVEKVTLTSDTGEIFELKDVYNNSALAPSQAQHRPSAMSVEYQVSATSYLLRFMGVPDAVYTVTLVYQKLAPQMGPYFISSVANHVSTTTAYTGVFDALSFPTGSTAVITGFTTSANNGSFVVVSCTSTLLTVTSSVGAAETAAAYACNFSWAPIPDQYSDVYNNLFLAEALAESDDNRAQIYRQRGVGALMAKSTGLTEMQKNAFAQQWLARNVAGQGVLGLVQLGQAGRGQ